ncbi:MAG: transposase, partial [Ktedonobacterales bacterium]
KNKTSSCRKRPNVWASVWVVFMVWCRRHGYIELIAPHRRNRKRPKTQDGRPLRRYKRRWKFERLFAWLGNFRRLVVRYERHALNYLGFVHLGCILILLRQSV